MIILVKHLKLNETMHLKYILLLLVFVSSTKSCFRCPTEFTTTTTTTTTTNSTTTITTTNTTTTITTTNTTTTIITTTTTNITAESKCKCGLARRKSLIVGGKNYFYNQQKDFVPILHNYFHPS